MKEREQFENLSVDGSIILKWILNKEDDRPWSGFSLERRYVTGCCGYDNEL
jgi:hypothetical protein